MTFMTSEELEKHRLSHFGNLQLLKDASGSWDKATRQRGEATMANLMQQVYDIDSELAMAGGK